MYAARYPIILADGEIRALRIVDEVQRISKATNWPTWTTPFGKGLLDETVPNFHGIYKGRFDDDKVRGVFDRVDLVLCFGPHHSSSNTYGYSSIPEPRSSIFFTDTKIEFDDGKIEDIPAASGLSILLQMLDVSRIPRYELALEIKSVLQPQIVSVASRDDPITHTTIWRIVNQFLRPGDIILGETGTAGYGVRELVLPRHTRLFAPATWLSIGYMLLAAQGIALAQEELQKDATCNGSSKEGASPDRTVLFVGDGSFQMTVQELSTIIRYNLNVVVFILNNEGYTIERCIHGLHAEYNDIAQWHYLQAPALFGATNTFTTSVKTLKQLETVLCDARLTDGAVLRLVELILGKEDVPEGPLADYMRTEKERIKEVPRVNQTCDSASPIN